MSKTEGLGNLPSPESRRTTPTSPEDEVEVTTMEKTSSIYHIIMVSS
jgi:hypothetical protein